MELLSDQETNESREQLSKLEEVLNSAIFGSQSVIRSLIVGILARGHILLEGLPGLGKTELVKSVAKAVALDVKRIQFTPDLLPGDITGNPILQEENGKKQFVFHRGPLFANIVLADEINRASPKTQSALLEAMQEKRATVMGQTHELPNPFFVLATQNPIELEGTYPLPEAQLDRFLFKLQVLRPDQKTLERIVLKRELGIEPEVPCVLTKEQLIEHCARTRRIFLPDAVAQYIARIVDRTQPPTTGVKFGAGPRAALALASSARALALLSGRKLASFEDVKAVAEPVLNHRIILDYGSKVKGLTTTQVTAKILAETPVLSKDIPEVMEAVQ